MHFLSVFVRTSYHDAGKHQDEPNATPYNMQCSIQFSVLSIHFLVTYVIYFAVYRLLKGIPHLSSEFAEDTVDILLQRGLKKVEGQGTVDFVDMSRQ